VPDKKDEGQLTTIVTTEHFTLQTARAAAIAQANGRMAAYLGAVSSAVIAVAFVAQIAGDETFFRVFGLVLLVPLAFLGLTTFERTLQLALEDIAYAKRINTLRRFYFRPGIDLDDYLMAPVEDGDVTAMIQQGGPEYLPGGLQGLLTNAGMAAVLNSFLTGVLVGSIVGMAGGNLALAVSLGALGFLLAGTIHYRHAVRAWRRLSSR
jgi:hypothetical protein